MSESQRGLLFFLLGAIAGSSFMTALATMKLAFG